MFHFLAHSAWFCAEVSEGEGVWLFCCVSSWNSFLFNQRCLLAEKAKAARCVEKTNNNT